MSKRVKSSRVLGVVVLLVALVGMSGCELLEAIPPPIEDIPTSELIEQLLIRELPSLQGLFDDD